MSKILRKSVLVLLGITLFLTSFLGDLDLFSIISSNIKNLLILLAVNSFFLIIERNVRGFIYSFSMFPLAFVYKNPALAVLSIACLIFFTKLNLTSDKANKFKIKELDKKSIFMNIALLIFAFILKDSPMLMQLVIVHMIIFNVQTASPLLLLALLVFISILSFKFVFLSLSSPFLVILMSLVISLTGIRIGFAIGEWIDIKK